MPLNRNTVALLFAALIAIGFFVAGLTHTLNYFIIKLLLILGLAMLFIVAVSYGVKNDRTKNRPEND